MKSEKKRVGRRRTLGSATRRATSSAGGGHESVKRPPLERMDRILEWLRNEEYPNCSRMMKEFGVDRKTAWRDIEFMKDRKDLPIPPQEGNALAEVSGRGGHRCQTHPLCLPIGLAPVQGLGTHRSA